MLVVSDTSPLNYLVLVEAIEVLPQLFTEVFVPMAVIDELRHERAPQVVRNWVRDPPPWLQIRSPRVLLEIPGLDLGEMEAIALAEELSADAILVDERDAAKVASNRGILAVGTLAVLARAIVNGLIDQESVAIRLANTNFRAPADLLDLLVVRLKRREGTA